MGMIRIKEERKVRRKGKRGGEGRGRREEGVERNKEKKKRGGR
jgi:hypothetical protein